MCVLMCQGIDVFLTRTYPSRSFDTLNEDFNYVMLITSFVALAAGVVIVHRMVTTSRDCI